jgi:hypothetical protein
MAALNGLQMAKLKASPVDYPEVADVGGRLRVFNEKITLAGQATTDTIAVARLPKGARVLYGVLTTDTSLGSSTIAIGVAGSTGKYRTAATFTATNTPTPFGNAAAVGEPLAADEEVIITIGAASLPGAGTLRVQMVFTVD